MLTGQAQISRELDRIARQLRRDVETSLLSEANTIGDSAQELVPVATGALRDSKAVDVRESPDAVESVVSFGSPLVTYAAIVHERESPGRKYLEVPLMAAERGLLSRIGKKLKSLL